MRGEFEPNSERRPELVLSMGAETERATEPNEWTRHASRVPTTADAGLVFVELSSACGWRLLGGRHIWAGAANHVRA